MGIIGLPSDTLQASAKPPKAVSAPPPRPPPPFKPVSQKPSQLLHPFALGILAHRLRSKAPASVTQGISDSALVDSYAQLQPQAFGDDLKKLGIAAPPPSIADQSGINLQNPQEAKHVLLEDVAPPALAMAGTLFASPEAGLAARLGLAALGGAAGTAVATPMQEWQEEPGTVLENMALSGALQGGLEGGGALASRALLGMRGLTPDAKAAIKANRELGLHMGAGEASGSTPQRQLQKLAEFSYLGSSSSVAAHEAGNAAAERAAQRFVDELHPTTTAPSELGKTVLGNRVTGEPGLWEQANQAFKSEVAPMKSKLDEQLGQAGVQIGFLPKGIPTPTIKSIQTIVRDAYAGGSDLVPGKARSARMILEKVIGQPIPPDVDLRKVLKLVQQKRMLRVIPFGDAEELRSDVIGLLPGPEDLVPGKVGGNNKLLAKSLTGDMEGAAALLDPEQKTAWKSFRMFYRKGANEFGNDVARKLMKLPPEKLVSGFIKPGEPSRVDQLWSGLDRLAKSGFGEAAEVNLAKNQIRRGFVEHLLGTEGGQPLTAQAIENLPKKLAGYGTEVTQRLFNEPQSKATLENMDRLGRVLNRRIPPASYATRFSMIEIFLSLASAASGAFTGGAVRGLENAGTVIGGVETPTYLLERILRSKPATTLFLKGVGDSDATDAMKKYVEALSAAGLRFSEPLLKKNLGWGENGPELPEKYRMAQPPPSRASSTASSPSAR